MYKVLGVVKVSHPHVFYILIKKFFQGSCFSTLPHICVNLRSVITLGPWNFLILKIFTFQAMQEKNSQLEKSLSSETKLKMDLFSALGDAKRELSIATGKAVNNSLI